MNAFPIMGELFLLFSWALYTEEILLFFRQDDTSNMGENSESFKHTTGRNKCLNGSTPVQRYGDDGMRNTECVSVLSYLSFVLFLTIQSLNLSFSLCKVSLLCFPSQGHCHCAAERE
jgi:hypothetical protein